MDELEKERERFAKLWDAYQSQEKELENCKRRISELEKIPVSGNLEFLRERDEKLRALESDLKELEKFKEQYEKEKDRLTKLYMVTGDIDSELADLKNEIRRRDKWFSDFEKNFRKNIEIFEKRRMMREK